MSRNDRARPTRFTLLQGGLTDAPRLWGDGVSSAYRRGEPVPVGHQRALSAPGQRKAVLESSAAIDTATPVVNLRYRLTRTKAPQPSRKGNVTVRGSALRGAIAASAAMLVLGGVAAPRMAAAQTTYVNGTGAGQSDSILSGSITATGGAIVAVVGEGAAGRSDGA